MNLSDLENLKKLHEKYNSERLYHIDLFKLYQNYAKFVRESSEDYYKEHMRVDHVSVITIKNNVYSSITERTMFSPSFDVNSYILDLIKIQVRLAEFYKDTRKDIPKLYEKYKSKQPCLERDTWDFLFQPEENEFSK
jgi:hypothetical protein